MASNAINGAVKDANGSYSKAVSPVAQQSKSAFPQKGSDTKKSDEDMSQR